MSQKSHQFVVWAKWPIWESHIWMEPISLGDYGTILGSVLGGPVGLWGPVFEIWGFEASFFTGN